MPTLRFLQPGGDGFYHCVSRVVDPHFVFDTTEKRHFRKWTRKLETFCGVEVITSTSSCAYRTRRQRRG